MILFKHFKDLLKLLSKYRKEGRTVGFVPTMGALHEGHLSLLAACKKSADISLCSIFVNPTQFNQAADLDKYPRTLPQDIDLLEQAGCDILFLPAEDEIYPPLFEKRQYDLGELETLWEGKHRPGHFQGVSMVLDILLSRIQPNWLFMGLKDYQQCRVVEKLLRLINSTAALLPSPTLRERDGLALSSRNLRLSPEQRQMAPEMYKTLQQAEESIRHKPPAEVVQNAIQRLEKKGFRVEYFAAVHPETMQELSEMNPGDEAVIVVAAYLGDIRLIDNLIIGGIQEDEEREGSKKT